jgi:regulation of enolase protein 1 (concanavalin A-like superfamily)
MTWPRTGLVALLVCLFLVGVGAAEQPARKVPGFGDLYDPDKDCDVGLGVAKLTVKVPSKAHDFAAELQRWNAPRVLSPAQGDFILEVKVGGELKPGENSTIPGRRPYHGAGLLLVKDKNNYVSLHRGAVYLDNRVRHYANFELRKDGDLAVSHYEVELEEQDTYLRVERRGSKFYALASHDGVHWKAYDEPIDVDFPAALRVGVEAVSSSDQPFRCTFEGLAIFRKTTPQTRQP